MGKALYRFRHCTLRYFKFCNKGFEELHLKMHIFLIASILIGCVFSQDADECQNQLPLFHGKLGDNWLSFIENSAPVFVTQVKQVKSKDVQTGVVTFKPRKKFSVLVAAKKRLRIKQLTIIAEKVSGSENCDMGSFQGFKKGAAPIYVPPLSSDCNTMVSFTSTKKRGVKKVVAKWRTPKNNPCNVALRVEIVASDNKIYNDNVEDEQMNEEGLKGNALTVLFKSAE